MLVFWGCTILDNITLGFFKGFFPSQDEKAFAISKRGEGCMCVCVKIVCFFCTRPPQKKVKSSFEFYGKFQLGKCSRKASQREMFIDMFVFQDIFAEFALNVGVVECNYNPFSVTT